MAPTWAKKLESRLKSARRGVPEPALTSPSTSQRKPGSAPQSNFSHSSLTIQERLWNQAYDELKTSETKTVEAYERLLSTELQKCSNPTSLGPGENKIGQSLEARSSQMQQLVQLGLDRTQKAASIKGHIGDGLEFIDTLKGIIDQAVSASPQASVAWVGIGFVLEILANPVKQTAINRSGITYVISRMKWSWHLAGLLLDENKIEKSSVGLRARLEEHVIELYQKLILFQIKCACLYYQNQGIVLIRDVFKLDDWESQIQDIKDAEAAVQRDSEQYNSEQVKSYLRDVAATAHAQEMRLEDVFLAIRNNTEQQERRHEDDKDKQCLKDLCVTDPREDKMSIEDTKGGLLRDSYRWILDHADFQRFRGDPQSRLLWIKGDPGKGKTMLLCGIIDELKKESAILLSYFFCQATKVQLSDATAVLRGIIFLLIDQQPSLISHVREKYDIAGPKLFEGINAWVSLTGILTNMLRDPNLEDTVLVIDALDECITNRPQLLDFIAKASSRHSRAKWIVSSRNQPDIEEQLADASNIRVQLELNADSISNAVHTFIQHKVDQLTRDKKYDTKTSAAVQRHMISNADGTFLWVALVCQMLADPKLRKWNTLTKLNSFPPGLDALYKRMLMYIDESDDADLCRKILAIVSTVYRPITFEELKGLVQSLEDFQTGDLEEVVGSCGSFLTIRKGVVLFVHQSAKDYLLDKAAGEILPSGIAHQHHTVVSRSLDILSRTLRRDIYDLQFPGVLIEEVLYPDPDPLASIRYSCIFWVEHLSDSNLTQGKEYNEILGDEGAVHSFFQKSYLYWLESLSLLKSISDGIKAVQKLESLLGNTMSQRLRAVVQDARRFILFHKSAVEIAPLQVYASALVFSPTNSLIRGLFKGEEPNWIVSKPKVEADWGARILTLESHGWHIKSVAFSVDGQRIVSASYDTINVWDTSTGACISTFEDYECSLIIAALLAADGDQVVSLSYKGAIKFWDVATGTCIKSALLGCYSDIRSATFSRDGKWLAIIPRDNNIIHIWDVATSVCVSALKGHSKKIKSVALSQDGQCVISGSEDYTCKIWDTNEGVCISTLEGHKEGISSVDLSMNGQRAVSVDRHGTFMTWDATTGACLSTFPDYIDRVMSVAISWDGQRVVTGYLGGTIKIWDATTGVCVSTFNSHIFGVTTISFSSDGQWVASSDTFDSSIKLWDASIRTSELALEDYRSVVLLALSTDGQRVVVRSRDGRTTIWDTGTGVRISTLEGHDNLVSTTVFSTDGQKIASGSGYGTTKIWDVTTGACELTLRDEGDDNDEVDSENESHGGYAVFTVVFSADGQRVASGLSNGTLKIWDLVTGMCTSLLGHPESPLHHKVAFSADGQRIASSCHGFIQIWDLITNRRISTVRGEPYINRFSDGGHELALSADGNQIASSSNGIVNTWDVATGKRTSTLKVGFRITRLSFDPIIKSRLFTNMGALNLDVRPIADDQIIKASSSSFVCCGYGISTDRTWIEKDGNRMLLIPANDEMAVSDIVGSTVAIVTRLGRLLMMQFS